MSKMYNNPNNPLSLSLSLSLSGAWSSASGCEPLSCAAYVPIGAGYGHECDTLVADTSCTQTCTSGYSDNSSGLGEMYTCPSVTL